MYRTIKDKHENRFLLLLLPLLFLCPQRLSAQTVYNYSFTGDLSIWDVSGTYTDDSIGGTINYTIAQDAKGKLTGFGTADVTIEDVDISMQFDIKGSVKQRNGIATVKLSLKFTGTATYMSETYRFRASEKVTAEINTATAVMNGIVKVSVTVQGVGSERETANISMTIPGDMDGSSDLDFEVNEDGRKLTGTGTLTLSNGETYDFTVSGKFNERKNESTFTFKPADNDAKGCKLKIKINEGTDQISSLKGKVLGQCVKQ